MTRRRIIAGVILLAAVAVVATFLGNLFYDVFIRTGFVIRNNSGTTTVITGYYRNEVSDIVRSIDVLHLGPGQQHFYASQGLTEVQLRFTLAETEHEGGVFFDLWPGEAHILSITPTGSIDQHSEFGGD